MYKGIRKKCQITVGVGYAIGLKKHLSALQMPTASKSDSRFESSFVWFQCDHHFLLLLVQQSELMFHEVDSIFVHAHPSLQISNNYPQVLHLEWRLSIPFFSVQSVSKRQTWDVWVHNAESSQGRLSERTLSINRMVVSGYKQLFEMLVSWLRKPPYFSLPVVIMPKKAKSPHFG